MKFSGDDADDDDDAAKSDAIGRQVCVAIRPKFHLTLVSHTGWYPVGHSVS
jgi:hypothetical protein